MNLKSLIANDITKVFLNTKDFCDNLNIQIGTTKLTLIGSLQSNSIQNNSGNGQPLQENSWTLYIAYPLDDSSVLKQLSAGTRIMIDNKSYSIVSISNELGLATIQLTTKVGR